MRYVTILMGALGICLSASGLRAETLEEVEKQISAEMAKHKSAQIKMKMKTDLTGQMTEKSEAEITAIYAKRGDKWLSHTESKVRGTRKFGDTPEQKTDSKVLIITDGEYSYNLIESAEGKQAVKMKQPIANPFGKEMWEASHKVSEMKLLPDEKIDGKSVWVIESRPKPLKDVPADSQPSGRSVSYYRKSDAAAVKTVAYDKDEKATVTMTMTDIKYDVDVKPEMFKFTAPEGVQVMDLTQAGGSQDAQAAPSSDSGSQASPEPKAEEKPKEEPKAQQPAPPKQKGARGLLNRLGR